MTIDDDVRALREALAAVPMRSIWRLYESNDARPHTLCTARGWLGTVDFRHGHLDHADERAKDVLATARYVHAAQPHRIARVLAELERLRADARRWQHMRAEMTWADAGGGMVKWAGYVDMPTPDALGDVPKQLDAGVDAAMAAQAGATQCLCTFAQRMQGDGCDVCNPAGATEGEQG